MCSSQGSAKKKQKRQCKHVYPRLDTKKYPKKLIREYKLELELYERMLHIHLYVTRKLYLCVQKNEYGRCWYTTCLVCSFDAQHRMKLDIVY